MVTGTGLISKSYSQHWKIHDFAKIRTRETQTGNVRNKLLPKFHATTHSSTGFTVKLSDP